MKNNLILSFVSPEVFTTVKKIAKRSLKFNRLFELLNLEDYQNPALSCIINWVLSWTEVWRRFINGTLEHSTVHRQASPFPRLWLVTGLGVDISMYKYQLQFISGMGSVFHYSLVHWAETHFGWPCSLVCRSGQVCLGSGGSQSRPSDIDYRKPAFMSCVPRQALRQALILSGGARFIAWHLRHPFLCIFRTIRHVWAIVLCLVPTIFGDCIGLQAVLFLSTSWTLVGIPSQVSVTVIILHLFHLSHCM